MLLLRRSNRYESNENHDEFRRRTYIDRNRIEPVDWLFFSLHGPCSFSIARRCLNRA
jgi:hypothetical protein